MTSDSNLKDALTAAAHAMPPNAQRAQDVVRRAGRHRRLRLVAASVAAVMSAITLAAVVTTAADKPRVVAASPSLSAEPSTRSVQFLRARAISAGIRIELVGADPSLPPSSPCARSYTATTGQGPHGELLVTVIASWRETTTAEATPTVCHAKGYLRWVEVPTDRTYDTVVDTVTGITHTIE